MTSVLTGHALVDEWRQVCLRAGWPVDEALPGRLFDALAERIDAVLLDAAARPRSLARVPLPENGRRGGETPMR